MLIKVVNKLIEKFFHTQKNSRFPINEKKADTLSELLKSVVRYALYFVSILWIAEQILPNSTKTILTLTSVAGVAIGFGAQSVVKDVIAGFFILFEDQFAVGDYIIVDNMSGVVEVVGLRVTKLRDFTGDLHIIPNGSIVKVTNKSRGNMRALVNVDIAYEEDIDHAVKVIKETCQEIKKDYQDIIVEGPDVSGVTNLGTSGITLRVIAKTVPMKQWDVEMELRRRIKYALDKEGIEIPYPRNVIIHKNRER
ncbi:mechanosensitive ion channel protein MscS [Fervidicella metallireducens AeB]|uniref:Mechanosensitive ion channel protein MscS n=1 Tax=Fervidicella metallireducens AeB TaxID=1403537 RepID=A0A017RW94_9CLOT|nr:mechanosensitive ion channel protein MscS [Fervidicella metallireducens AeB]